MAGQRQVGSVTYREADAEYFKKRMLRRYAGVWSLWALGVGAVISGEYSGWNFGLDAGGFGGLLVATVVITVMYFGLCWSIAEMSPALPHTGGAYSFGRSAMGPWGGFATGVAETIEYVVTPAVIVTFAASYLDSIAESWFSGSPPLWLWWAILYVIFVALNVVGVEASFRFTVFICLLALGILTVFYVASLWEFSWDNLTNIAAEPGNSDWFPFGGVEGIFLALPFAIWFYLAIEELPLAAEESADPKRDIPKGTIYGLITLVVFAFLVLFLNTGVTGAEEIRVSGEPVLDGFRVIFGTGGETTANILGLAAVAAIIASFHTIIFAYGRNIFSLSRAGYYPHWLSRTHGTRQHAVRGADRRRGRRLRPRVPARPGDHQRVARRQPQRRAALDGRRRCRRLVLPADGVVRAAAAEPAGHRAAVSQPGRRRRRGGRRRSSRSSPWRRSSGGTTTARASSAWRSSTPSRCSYFALVGRHKLVLSPEEEFAMTRGEHGNPETEGYGHAHIGAEWRDLRGHGHSAVVLAAVHVVRAEGRHAPALRFRKEPHARVR